VKFYVFNVVFTASYVQVFCCTALQSYCSVGIIFDSGTCFDVYCIL